MTEAAWTDRIAAPLGGVRRAIVSVALRNPGVRALASSRDRRALWILGVHACVAFALTTLLPAPLIVLVPLVLGVPHVVADLRYLVFRRPVASRHRALIVAGCALLGLVNALALIGVRFDVARTEVVLGSLALGMVAVVALARVDDAASLARRARALAVLCAVASFGYIAIGAPRTALIVLLHVHNWVAVVVWLWLFRGRLCGVFPALLVVVGCAGLLVSGLLTATTLRFGVWNALGTNLLVAADWLAPGLPDGVAVGLASSFIFLQSVHYLIWLVLVPMDELSGNGSMSFRRCFDRSRFDLRPAGVATAAIAWAAVLGFGVKAPVVTRNAYLALASFHVWLELSVLVFFAARGRAITMPDSPGRGALAHDFIR